MSRAGYFQPWNCQHKDDSVCLKDNVGRVRCLRRTCTMRGLDVTKDVTIDAFAQPDENRSSLQLQQIPQISVEVLEHSYGAVGFLFRLSNEYDAAFLVAPEIPPEVIGM